MCVNVLNSRGQEYTININNSLYHSVCQALCTSPNLILTELNEGRVNTSTFTDEETEMQRD